MGGPTEITLRFIQTGKPQQNGHFLEKAFTQSRVRGQYTS